MVSNSELKKQVEVSLASRGPEIDSDTRGQEMADAVHIHQRIRDALQNSYLSAKRVAR